MGHVIANAMLESCPDCKVALMNAGGIRASINIGEITYGDVVKAFPYDNTVSTAKITGKKLVEVLSHAIKGEIFLSILNMYECS